MVHNLVYEPRKGESNDPGDVSCDSRYRHHRVVLRYRHPVVVVDASLEAGAPPPGGSRLVIEALRLVTSTEGLSLAHIPGPIAPGGLRAYLLLTAT
jgi:hypothetical protein